MSVCKVEGCDNVVYCKGFCEKHYLRMKKHGTTDYVGRQTIPSKARFKNNLCYLEVYTKDKRVVAEAIIDAEDYDKIKDYRLHLAKPDKNKDYIKVRTNTGVLLHHIILVKRNKDLLVDHKNRYTLDNRKCNLRLATYNQNGMNRGKYPNKTSIYKGVCWDKSRNKWKAEIKLNRIGRHIGRFNNEVEAAKAYNKKAEELFGEYACINQI